MLYHCAHCEHPLEAGCIRPCDLCGAEICVGCWDRGSFCPHTDPAEQRPPELVTYAKVRERDRVRLIRDATRFTQVFLPGDPPPPGIPVTTVYPAGRIGVVTMKAKDGMSGKPIVRVRFPGLGEPWFDFPPPPGLEELAYV